MLIDALILTLYQLIIFVGAVYVIGFLISLINRTFYRLTEQGRAVCLATGLIGTPIHELSHAVMCLIFFHKITDIKLYQTNEDNGVLGYVNHSYNRRNIYQLIGNYFIGVAPIIVGAAILYMLIKFMLPAAFAEVQAYLLDFVALQKDGLTLDIFSYLLVVVSAIVKIIFTIDFGFMTVIFLLICLCISLHMNLSGADIKGSLSSLPIIAVLLFLLNLILQLISGITFASFHIFMMEAGCYLLALLSLSLVFSFIILMVGILVHILRSVVR